MTQLTQILIAQWLEHLIDITQAIGSITTWNSEVFPVVPCPVAKEPSFRKNNILFCDLPYAIHKVP